MSRDSGFVPIRFNLAGKMLLVMGIIGLVVMGIDTLTGWFSLPSIILIVSAIMILVSLYLIVLPREKEVDG